MENHVVEPCPGLRMKRVEGGDKPGSVTASVPQRCIPGSRFVQFEYRIQNFGGDVVDHAPGRGRGHEFTRWVKRG